MEELGVVVTLVEVFEDRGEDLWDFFREGDSFGVGLEELATGYGGEEGRGIKDALMGSEEASGVANGESNYGGVEVAIQREVSLKSQKSDTRSWKGVETCVGDDGSIDLEVLDGFSIRWLLAGACSLNERCVRLFETLFFVMRCFEKLPS